MSPVCSIVPQELVHTSRAHTSARVVPALPTSRASQEFLTDTPGGERSEVRAGEPRVIDIASGQEWRGL